MAKKNISKRHLRRKIAANAKLAYENLTLQNSSTIFDTKSHVSILKCNTNLNCREGLAVNHTCSRDSPQLIEKSVNSDTESFVIKPNFYSPAGCFEVDKIWEREAEITSNAYEKNFLIKFRNWATSNNITHKSVNQLVCLIKDRYPFLPRDARSILLTPTSIPTTKLKNGEMVYLGLVNGLLEKLKYGYINDINCNSTNKLIINLEVNADGIPIYNSSSLEFWPILVRSKNFKNQNPFAVGIFCGVGKPDTIEMFLRDFIDESLAVLENGFQNANQNYAIAFKYFTCDAPARAFLKQIKGHTSIFGCERCHIKSLYQDKKRFYPVGENVKLRKDSDYGIETDDDTHIKSISPLTKLSIGLASMFVLDPMHLIFLGVMRRLLLVYWIEGKRDVKLSKSVIANIDVKIRANRKYITNDFKRKMRCLKDIKRWKATEYRFFLLYFGPMLLRSCIDNKLYRHFLLLHSAIFILSSEKLTAKHVTVAKSLLVEFVESGSNIYGKHFIVYNVHSLLHVCDDVQLYGDINNYSCFAFESYLGQLKRLIRGKYLPLQQINNRLHEINNSFSYSEETNVHFKPIYTFDNSCNYFQCKKLKVNNNLLIATSSPDNVVAVGKKLYIIKSILCIDNIYNCIANQFRYQQSFYDYPLDSTKLGIYYAWSEGNQAFFKVSDITIKYIAFPCRNGFYCSPILHHT